MIGRARIFALQLVRAYASHTGNARLHAWAWHKLVDNTDEAGA